MKKKVSEWKKIMIILCCKILVISYYRFVRAKTVFYDTKQSRAISSFFDLKPFQIESNRFIYHSFRPKKY